MMNSHDDRSLPPRLDIIRAVLESALDAGAQEYVAACRRLLRADLIGWRRHADCEDWTTVLDAYENMRADVSAVDAKST